MTHNVQDGLGTAVAPELPPPTPAAAAPPRPRIAWAPLARTVARAAPFLVAALYLVLGLVHYLPGVDHDASPEAYRDWTFPAFKYSDLIWLYLRDDLADRPLPYLDYDLEYPPLTGLLSYLLSLAPGTAANYVLTYLVLALCGLATVAALRRLPGANPWYYAAAPALLFYTGYQWDPAAIAVTALALVAYARGHDRWGTVGMTAAVWLKLFPIVWVGAAVVERVRERRYRAAGEIVAIFAAVSVAINVPLAVADWDGWTFFYTWNRERAADAGFWVYLQHLSTPTATSLSLVLSVLGATGLALIALQAKRPVLLPLGASVLLWWLLVNKTFTTHLVLWVFLALAVLHPTRLLWFSFVAVDVFAFQLGNYVNIPIVDEFRGGLIVPLAWRHIYDPLQLLRVAQLLLAVAWAVDRWFLDRAASAWVVARVRALIAGTAPPHAAPASEQATSAPSGERRDGRQAAAVPAEGPRPRRRWHPLESSVAAGAALLLLGVLLPTGVWAAGVASGEEVRREDFAEVVSTPQRQPGFTGQMEEGVRQSEFAIRPPVNVRWNVEPAADGSFETVVPVALPPGTFTYSVGDEAAGEVVVAAGESGSRPRLSGRVAAGTRRVQLSLSPPILVKWWVTTEVAGSQYRTQVPVRLDPGRYALYVDGILARRILVEERER